MSRITQKFRCLLLLMAAVASLGWVLPGSYKNYSKPTNLNETLDYIVMQINGERRVFAANSQINILRGDRLKVIEAVLKDRSVRPEVVNVIGYSTVRSKGANDVGIEVNTAEQFKSVWSLEKSATKFAITVSTETLLHGLVILNLELPQLSYVDLLVNQKLKVMRKDEVLVLGADDRIKVKEIRTNIKEGPKAEYRVVKTDNGLLKKNHLRAAESFEIQFSRAGLVFAKVPMLIENL